MTDKNNRQERVWNDPPMVDENRGHVAILPENITLGAGVSPEIRDAFAGLEQYYRMARLVTAITIAVTYAVSYIVITSIPGVTPADVTNFFGLIILVIVISEVLRYHKIL